MPRLVLGDRNLSNQLSRVARRLFRRDLFVPEFARDVYLASYPRSGNTWMRLIIAQLLYGISEDKLNLTNRLVPDLHRNPRHRDVDWATFYVVKTHFPKQHRFFPSDPKYVIYLIRDPRDVVLSYRRYLARRHGELRNIHETVTDFCRGRLWPSSWVDHVQSWEEDDVFKPCRCLWIRYEDMVESPLEVIDSLRFFFKVEPKVEPERIIATAQPRALQNLDGTFLTGKTKSVEKFPFVGQATHGYWQDELPDELAHMIESYCGEVMTRHGYACEQAELRRA